MATVTGFTADRMLVIEGSTVVDGEVDSSGDLILQRRDGVELNAGSVIGPPIDINTTIKVASDAPSTYPVGISVFTYGAGDTTDFPATLGTVFTYLANIARGYQIITEKGTTPKFWMRNIAADNVWGDFQQVVTVDINSVLGIPKVRLSATNDLSESSTAHAFQIGPDNGVNLAMDNNEIMVRDNGVGVPLYVQFGLNTDAASYTPTSEGHLTHKKYVDSYVRPSELDGTVNLNTLRVQSSAYIQSSNTEALTTLNYPVQRAGLLEVFAHPTVDGMAWQRYTLYASGTADQVSSYIRGFYNGSWSTWKTERYDSDWVSLSPASGFSSSPSGIQVSASCRRLGDTIRFRGVISGSLTVGTTTTIATVPSSHRPTGNDSNMVPIVTTNAFIGWANVTKAGALTVHFKSPFATGATVFELTNLSYTID